MAARLENPLLKGFLKGGTPDQGPVALGKLIQGIIQFFIFIGFLIFIIYFFLGAFSWIISQGDEGKLKEAKKRIENAIIGLLLVFSVFAFLKVLGIIFGLESLRDLRLIILPLVS